MLAIVAGQGELAAVPAGAGGSSLVVIVPAIGLVAAVAGRVPAAGGGAGGLAGHRPAGLAACLAGWALLRLTVLWKPVLPTELPENLDRVATAVAVGVAVGVAVLTLRSGAVTPAPLTDDE